MSIFLAILICPYYSSEFDHFPISIIDNTVEYCIFLKFFFFLLSSLTTSVLQYRGSKVVSGTVNHIVVQKYLESEWGVDFQNY